MSSAAVHRCAARAVQGVLDRYRPNVVCFDTETTGLRGAVIQAAAIEMASDGTIVDDVAGIVPPPEGVSLEPGAVRVHGISQATIDAEGQPPLPFLHGFLDFLERAHAAGKPVVAHNSAFDVARLDETMRWHGSKRRCEVPVVCTMRASKRHSGLVTARVAPKNPSNAELYHSLTGRVASEDVEALHDARADATITARSYVEGRRQGWW